MKSIIVVLIIISIFFIATREEVPQENYTDPIEAPDTPKKTYIDSPINTYKSQVEAQNIANTINPSSSYLGSRLDARGMSKDAVKEANKRMEEQNKAMEAF
jgi:thioredoxin-related protein